MHGSVTVSGSYAATETAANGFRVGDQREYNPLSVEELGRNAVRRLMEYPATQLPPAVSFTGAGVYTIHYRGDYQPYAGLPDEESIYVGKAEIRGRRQVRAGKARPSADLHKRLSEHAASIEAAHNLHLGDFRCRWLILDSIWIGLTEQVLIAAHRPLWNSVVDGFDNHDPGGGRGNARIGTRCMPVGGGPSGFGTMIRARTISLRASPGTEEGEGHERINGAHPARNARPSDYQPSRAEMEETIDLPGADMETLRDAFFQPLKDPKSRSS